MTDPSTIRKHPKARLGWKIERAHWNLGKRVLVGLDEAGRGPLAGPVVAAAVSFTPECCRSLPYPLLSLDDSKQLKPEEREQLYEVICGYSDAFGIGMVDQVEIDRTNILQATMRAMTIAVEELRMKLFEKGRRPEMLLVDGNYFRTPLKDPFQTVVGGDATSPHIAAASILAKVTRDRIMSRLDGEFPEYHFATNKGYGTKEHCAAIRMFGFSPVHRLSFKLKALEGTAIDLFDSDDGSVADTAALGFVSSISLETAK